MGFSQVILCSISTVNGLLLKETHTISDLLSFRVLIFFFQHFGLCTLIFKFSYKLMLKVTKLVYTIWTCIIRQFSFYIWLSQVEEFKHCFPLLKHLYFKTSLGHSIPKKTKLLGIEYIQYRKEIIGHCELFNELMSTYINIQLKVSIDNLINPCTFS